MDSGACALCGIAGIEVKNGATRLKAKMQGRDYAAT